jgi:hypothetical protein
MANTIRPDKETRTMPNMTVMPDIPQIHGLVERDRSVDLALVNEAGQEQTAVQVNHPTGRCGRVRSVASH